MCISRGVLVQESTPQLLVCGKTMSGSDAMLATLMVGNSYSTTPERKVRFTIFQLGPNVRLTVDRNADGS
jgi:hypothetical protein